MIRETTPLPKRPSIERREPMLLDEMLRLLARCPPMCSGDIVKIVKQHANVSPKPCAVDIRLMLCQPYFRLENAGWVCTFNLPIARREWHNE